MANQCKWITQDQKKCTNSVLMDGYCTRHLKQKCSICWENVPSTNSGNHKRLKCGHAFHFQCIIKWFNTSDCCPVCRKVQVNDPLIIFKNEIENKMRKVYKDAIKSLEKENYILRRNMP
jgi:hypothetical protein